MRRRRSEEDSRSRGIAFFNAEILLLTQAGREAGIDFTFAELVALVEAGWPAGIGTQTLSNQSISHPLGRGGEGIYGREEANRNNVNSPYHRYPPYHSKIKNTRR